jgi:TM2 domain-containing membrane protein YozV
VGAQERASAYIELVANRTFDASAIERRLLELAYTTEAKLTAPALAYFAPCSIEDAAKVLDDLSAHDRLAMEIEDDGTIVYHLPGRQKLGTAAPAMAPSPRALVPFFHRAAKPTASPMLAAALSMFVPGAGHIYTGRPIAAFLWFLVVSMGYALILPGLVLHLFSIASAASSAHRLNASAPLLLAAAAM